VEHLRGYASAHPDLPAQIDPRLKTLAEDAVAVFGMDEARALLATLGPVQQGLAAECDCNIFDNFFCWDCQGCISCPCTACSECTESGCGPLWTARCNGVCQ
jgi:hypothetical protein